MAWTDDLFKGFDGDLSSIVLGFGAAILAPIAIPVLAEVGKPLLKAGIKEGISLYDKGKEIFAEATEVFEDIVAEAKAELAEEQAAKTALASQPAPIEIES